MIAFLVAFSISYVTTFFIIRSQALHQKITNDYVQSGPQKIHLRSVPRIGGLAIILGIIAALLFRLARSPNPQIEIYLLLSVLPVFLIGFLEDLTKKIGVPIRLFIIIGSALLGVYILEALIPSIDTPGISYLFLLPGFSLVFSVFAITGLVNAYNIIDGLNGLSSMVAIISLIAIAYVNYLVGDLIFFSLSTIMVGAILGFFLWNYPRGLIFLGDGGSYLIGYWVAILSILLVTRNMQVSPWFALLVNAYPIVETLFTIYRRMVHQGKSPGQADAMHFHSLLYRRVFKSRYQSHTDTFTNSRTSPYLWFLSGGPTVCGIIFWQKPLTLILIFTLFTLFYIWLYQSIVRFKTPQHFHYF